MPDEKDEAEAVEEEIVGSFEVREIDSPDVHSILDFRTQLLNEWPDDGR